LPTCRSFSSPCCQTILSNVPTQREAKVAVLSPSHSAVSDPTFLLLALPRSFMIVLGPYVHWNWHTALCLLKKRGSTLARVNASVLACAQPPFYIPHNTNTY
jgi:hypothetical protein